MAATSSAPYVARSWWGQRELGVDVLEAARDRCRRAFREFDHVFVSFSGGKDSTCTLQVALDVARELGKLPLRAVFYDEECISYETERYVRRVANSGDVAVEWYCLPVRHRNGCSREEPIWWPWAPEHRELWVRPMPPEALTELHGFHMKPPESRPSIPKANPLLAPYSRYGRAVMLMGIRAQESMLRRRAVSNHRVDNWMHRLTTSMWKAYPIYDWTTEDVWIAPEKLGWDYNETYDIMEMGGVPRGLQRLAPPFGEEPLQLLWIWAKCFPDVWDGMCARVPGAATAALYSRSELYSFRTRSEKPEELSWQDFLMAKLSQHEPAVRAAVARKLQEMIRRHYAKTSDPILVEAAHPASGISWNLLLFVADRGDLKNRRSGSALPVGPAYEAAKKRYTEELARCREHGQG